MLVVPAMASSTTRAPTLRVVGASPLTVRGEAFAAREAVVVTVRQEGRMRARRSLRAGSRGGFAVAFAGAAVHRCGGGATITAVGATGAVAKAKLPQTACPPPLASP